MISDLGNTTLIMWLISVVVLTMSLVMVLAGGFTMYFGSGKSRKIGVALFIVGLLIGTLYVFMSSSYYEDFMGTTSFLSDVPITMILKETMLYVAAVSIGALIGIGAFLVAVMKA